MFSDALYFKVDYAYLFKMSCCCVEISLFYYLCYFMNCDMAYLHAAVFLSFYLSDFAFRFVSDYRIDVSKLEPVVAKVSSFTVSIFVLLILLSNTKIKL
jgi:hypothetical protein